MISYLNSSSSPRQEVSKTSAFHLGQFSYGTREANSACSRCDFSANERQCLPPGFHTTAREPKHAHLRSRPSITPPNFHETTPKRGRKNENCGGRVKKRAKFWAVRSGGGGGPAEGSGERPNCGRTHENFEHTPHTTGDPAQGGLGRGGSLAGRSMAQKTRHEQQSVPKSSPIGHGFLGSRMVRKGLGTKRFEKKAKRGGLGQK